MNFLGKIKKICNRKKCHKARDRINIKELKKIFILNELKGNESFLGILLSYCHILKVYKGDIIYREGDNSSAMYIVLKGTVRIYKHTSTGEQFLLTELHGDKGGFFGEIGLIQCQKRSASVRAETDAKLLVLPRKDFIRMAKKQPSIAIGLVFSICRVLSERLQRTNDDLSYLYDALAYEASES